MRGTTFFDAIVGCATEKHLGVQWDIVNPVYKVEFSDLFVNVLLDVRVWNRAFENKEHTSCA